MKVRLSLLRWISYLMSRRKLAVGLCVAGTLLALTALGVSLGIFAFGGTDVNVITGGETSPRVVQSETAVWSHGNTVVIAYNDSSGAGLTPFSYCGVSVSTNGGATFTRLPDKFNVGGQCIGDPDVTYSVRAGAWFFSSIAERCGASGIGLWRSMDGTNWTNFGCVATGTSQERGSLWVDNNSASPFFGRIYAAYGDFAYTAESFAPPFRQTMASRGVRLLT